MKEQESAPAAIMGNGASPPFGPSSIIPPFTPGMGPNFAPAKAPAFPRPVHQPMPAVTAPSTGDPKPFCHSGGGGHKRSYCQSRSSG